MMDPDPSERSPLGVVVLDDYQDVATTMADWSSVPGGADVRSLHEHVDDPAELAARIGTAEVLVVMRERTPVGAELLELLPGLRLLVTTGPSNAVVDVGAARALGIEVCGTGGYLSTTAEHTWALILALARRVPTDDRAVRAGGWQQPHLATELRDRVLGIVGLGRLGTQVAAVGRAFGMEVVAWSENLDAGVAESHGVTPVSRDELFSRADVVTIHLVLSERTRGLIGADELARMKPSAVLVNTARGPIVDEAALVDALRAQRIGGAALDVFDVEPLPADHPLRSLPNVVLTPHTGYVSDGLYQLFYREIVEDVAAWVSGAPIRVVR